MVFPLHKLSRLYESLLLPLSSLPLPSLLKPTHTAGRPDDVCLLPFTAYLPMLTLDLAPIAHLLRQASLSATQQSVIEQAIAHIAEHRRCSRRQAVQLLHNLAFD